MDRKIRSRAIFCFGYTYPERPTIIKNTCVLDLDLGLGLGLGLDLGLSPSLGLGLGLGLCLIRNSNN